jgi:uncharacterized membrane protein
VTKNEPGAKLLDNSFPILHNIFIIGIVLKGLNSLTELSISAILFIFPLDSLRAEAVHLSSVKRLEWFRSHNIINISRIENFAAPDMKAFFSWFFLSHGAIKAIIIICLFARWVWAYPLGIVVFSGFVIYQIIEMIQQNNTLLYFVLTILDLFVIILTFNEWHHAKRKMASVTVLDK